MKSITFLINEALITFKRFPLVLIASFLTAATAIYFNHMDASLEQSKLVMTCLLGVPLFLACSLFVEGRKIVHRPSIIALNLVALSFLILYQVWINSNDTKGYEIGYIQLSFAIHLLVSFSAFIGRSDELGFWKLNKDFFVRILISFIYASVFFGGLAIAVAAVTNLFGMEFNQKIYFNLWAVSAFVLQTWHFLAGLPKNLAEPVEVYSYPKVLRYFVQYLLIPLISLYTVILYCYMTKILVTGDWPKGFVGWLISIMSVLGILNLLLIHPESKTVENKWITQYTKFYYIMIIPLLLMLYVAVGKRVIAYGFTENRYFLLILGIWLNAIALYFIFSTRKNIKIVPVSLFILTILTLWGPTSARSISLNSQYKQALAILKKYDMIDGAKLKAAQGNVTYDDEKSLSSTFDYIIQHHGTQALQDWIPESVIDSMRESTNTYSANYARNMRSTKIMSYLGVKYRYRYDYESDEYFHFSVKNSNESVILTNFNYLVRIDTYGEAIFKLRDDEYSLSFAEEKSVIQLNKAGVVLATVNMSAALDGIQETMKKENMTAVTQKLLTIDVADSVVPFTFAIEEISGHKREGGKHSIDHVSGFLLFK